MAENQPGKSSSHVRFSADLDASSSAVRSEQYESVQSSEQEVKAPQPKRAASRTRDRGYSLRRTLFTQGIQKHNEERGSVMEMEPSSSRQQDSTFAKSSKGPTVITVEETRRNSSSASGSETVPAKYAVVRPFPLSQTKRPGILRQVQARIEALQALFNRTVGPAQLPKTADGRHVSVNVHEGNGPTDERTGKPYITNMIRSCKYTLWNFFPKQLVAQFGKLANFYFLVISILQMIPGLSTTGTFTTIVPLLIFVSVSMAKEGYEDICRNRLDKEDNESLTLVLNSSALTVESKSAETVRSDSPHWSKKKWQDLKVGDVVLLERDDAVPADIVLIQASGVEGAAQIETKSLDGETNLKSKKPLDAISRRCPDEPSIARLEADFVVEDPNLDLYKFDGRVSLAGETIPLTSNEVIYRGSIVRNTPYAVGLVVYSGEECKIRMNANKNPRVKAPTLQAKVNRVVVMVACLVFFIAAILTIGYAIWQPSVESKSWYLINAEVPIGHVFTSFVIMLNTMLPLSLYISLEIVKVAQMFMMNDIDMYDPVTDIPMEPKTSSLNEELGQVSYIFSDKTGTLTNNSMKFRKMSIAGTAWLHDYDLLGADQPALKLKHKKRSKGKEKIKHRRHESKAALLSTETNADSTGRITDNRGDIQPLSRTDDLLEYIRRRPQSLFARKVRFFLLAMALCHTCVPERDDEGQISYQAASPDELALVTAAQDLGFIATDRQTSTMVVNTVDPESGESSQETYQILDVIEFSSVRKRMSILIRLPDGRICLLTKGADTIVRQLLAKADVAAMYVDDIRRKSNARKSMDSYAAIRRRSTQIGRISISGALPARSTSIGRQSSVSLGRRHSVKESIDLWLREREAESLPRKSSVHQTSRLSQNQSSLPATKHSIDSPRASFQTEELNDLVDESITINDNAVFEKCFNHIDEFATEGLRTLVYAHRFVPEDEYMRWKQLYHAASTSLTDRQNKIEKVAESIEQQLELTGATAIEDKLQAGVPDAIERFRRAGIKMWMLTGDKRETAINIGHSCRLIKDYSNIMVLDQEAGALLETLQKFVYEVQSGRHAHSVLVIDGQTLTGIDTDENLKSLFTDLAIATDSVICCRASPSQKADLVKTIRLKVKGSVTLAIGDGANDIAMIQEAHVGIGIAGKEGLQAARTSDYSIGQFRFLLKLLLVHGRWNYVRVCKYTLGTFWKEMLFYLVQATYQRWNGYTGTSLFEPWSLSMFNTLFTSLPVIFMGVFEKDLAPATLLAVPELYSFGHENRGFNIPLYLWWAFLGAVEAMIVYFIMFGIYGEAQFTRDNQLFAMGALAFTACVTLISLKLQFFELHNKSLMAALAIFLSLGGWWLWNLILSQVYNKDNRLYNVNGGLVEWFGQNPLWWLTIILTVLAVSVFEIMIKAIKTIYFPNDVELFQVYERDPEIKRRFEESASALLQQGWDRGVKKSSIEIVREEEEQAKREAEVQDILDRPRTMTGSPDAPPPMGIRKRQSWAPVDLEMIPTNQEVAPVTERRSIDVGELFTKGYGFVRKDTMK